MRIPYRQMEETLRNLFLQYRFPLPKAQLLARVHTESTLIGVNSHGLNRVPSFIEYIRQGVVRVDAEAEPVEAFGTIERWDGQGGPGVINATTCTDRAIVLARQHGIGLVALRNTNHWMRAGTYGGQAADEGCVAILFTNTTPNMPPWGGRESRLGNNPLVIAIPRTDGNIVLDMALSQFSFGKVHSYHLKGEPLPFFGGWDADHNLTKDPEQILATTRGLPIGYWKGSALSMVLDMLATLLSAGQSTYRIGQSAHERGVSQVFLCISAERLGDGTLERRLLQEIIDYTHAVSPIEPGGRTYYPGERSREIRKENLAEGIPVDPSIWEQVVGLVT